MLFIPDWIVTKTADPLALDTLIHWLERQRPDQQYNYKNCTDCPLAMYFSEHGYRLVEVSKNFLLHKSKLLDREMVSLPEFFNWIVEVPPQNMGHALRRARIARDDPDRARKECFAYTYMRGEA
jgi:hypothetical protein